jgi:hypothetical protein
MPTAANRLHALQRHNGRFCTRSLAWCRRRRYFFIIWRLSQWYGLDRGAVGTRQTSLAVYY